MLLGFEWTPLPCSEKKFLKFLGLRAVHVLEADVTSPALSQENHSCFPSK